MSKILVFCLLVLCLVRGEDRIYFMPYEKKEALEALKNNLTNARESIQIAVFSFTNKEIAKVLRDQAKKGVKISIVYDKESNINNSYSTIGYLGSLRNIEVCVLQGLKNNSNAKNKKEYYGIMHQKLAIIDGKIVMLGSANWSKSAFESNYENLFITSQNNIVQKTQYYFAQMLKECKPY